MTQVKKFPSFKALCILVLSIYLVQTVPIQYAYAGTPWDVTKERSPLWNNLTQKMNAIVSKYDTPQNPWYLSNGKVNTNHPMYGKAKTEFNKSWSGLWDKGRKIDY